MSGEKTGVMTGASGGRPMLAFFARVGTMPVKRLIITGGLHLSGVGREC